MFASARGQVVALLGGNDRGQAVPPKGCLPRSRPRWPRMCAGQPGSGLLLGENGDGQSTPPTGAFTAVTAAVRILRLRADGAAVCWGAKQPGRKPATSRDLRAGERRRKTYLRITTSGRVSCWGDRRLGQARSPSGSSWRQRRRTFNCGFGPAARRFAGAAIDPAKPGGDGAV